METSIVGLQRTTTNVDLDTLVVGLESLYLETDSDLDLGMEDLSGWLSSKVDSIKAKISSVLKDWFFPVKLLSVSNLNDLSDEDKLRLIKRSQLEYYYYNPKAVNSYIQHLGTLAKFVSYAESKDYDAEVLNTHVLGLVSELQTMIRDAGQVPISNLNLKPHEHLEALHKQHKQILKDYIPSQNAVGDIIGIRRLVIAIDQNKAVAKRAERILEKLQGLSVKTVVVGTVITILVIVLVIVVIRYVILMIMTMMFFGLLTALVEGFSRSRQKEISVST